MKNYIFIFVMLVNDIHCQGLEPYKDDETLNVPESNSDRIDHNDDRNPSLKSDLQMGNIPITNRSEKLTAGPVVVTTKLLNTTASQPAYIKTTTVPESSTITQSFYLTSENKSNKNDNIIKMKPTLNNDNTTITLTNTTAVDNDTPTVVTDTTAAVTDATAAVTDTTLTNTDTTTADTDTTTAVTDTATVVKDTTVAINDTAVSNSDTTATPDDAASNGLTNKTAGILDKAILTYSDHFGRTVSETETKEASNANKENISDTYRKFTT